MIYDDLSVKEKQAFNGIDLMLNSVSKVGLKRILKILCAKYGVKLK